MPKHNALITSRDPRGRQAVSIFEAAYDQAKLNAPRAQLLNERGDKLKSEVLRLINDLSASGSYVGEEVSSSYTYPKKYPGPKPIEEQIKSIAEIFSLDSSDAIDYAKRLPNLPSGAEGWFAIPSDNGLKKLFPSVDEKIQRYCIGVGSVLRKLNNSLGIYNPLTYRINPGFVRICSRTTMALESLSVNQTGDILIVAAQLGLRHRGRSVRRAQECFSINEFGLGLLAVGSIILVNPTRILCSRNSKSRSDSLNWLDMECIGDECRDTVSTNVFDSFLAFKFGDKKVELGLRWHGFGCSYAGAVTAFLPSP